MKAQKEKDKSNPATLGISSSLGTRQESRAFGKLRPVRMFTPSNARLGNLSRLVLGNVRTRTPKRTPFRWKDAPQWGFHYHTQNMDTTT